MSTIRVAEYRYGLAGFPVILRNVEVMHRFGEDFPLIDHNEANRRILLELAMKATKLTGNQVRYIRHALAMSMEQFAQIFGFKRQSVHAWEKHGNAATHMERPAELVLRMLILRRFGDRHHLDDNLWNLTLQDPDPAETIWLDSPNDTSVMEGKIEAVVSVPVPPRVLASAEASTWSTSSHGAAPYTAEGVCVEFDHAA